MVIILYQPLYITSTFLIFLSLILVVPVLSVDPFTQALLSLKSDILDNSNSLSDWILPSNSTTDSRIHACSWSGVKCNGNSSLIIGLDISVKNLGGVFSDNQFSVFSDLVDLNLSHNSFSEKLPVGIFKLTNLKSLDISRNNFSGHFPSGISNLDSLVILDAFSNSFSGPLPKDASEIESLKVLNFAGSYFSGPIPSEYGSFKNLDFIHLAGNSLSGKIPPELGMLKTVTHMEIGYNSYEGSIPWEFGNMSKLQYLDIASANLSGSIPKELSNVTNLESLFLFRNQLSGKIPWEFGKLISLSSLDLSDNLLSGPVPESFSELKNIKLLSLMYNDLRGTVPEGIAKLPLLDSLNIWDNFFSGSLPKDLGKYSKLKYLDVSTNYLVGSIPPSICSNGVLERLILFSNNFTGGLSPSLSNCSSLVRIRIEDNSFSGDISLNFSNFPDLSYVDMSRNKFSGGIPSNIALASKLQYFNVSDNPNLGGIISEKTLSLYSLQNFSATNCSISGDFPPFGSCKSLLVLELSMNNVSGIIPQSISNCQNLVSLDLANNNLTGQIPVELAALPVISVVDLSHNSFSGSIPAKFGSSSSLQLLNVSFNDLSGWIPFKTVDSSAFLGNPKLCGTLWEPCRGPNILESGSRRTQKLAWVLITCGIIVLAITAAVFGVFYFRRRGKGQWKMVSFSGLPQFTANDVLRSFNSIEEATEMVPPLGGSDCCKAVLPTGITVLVKKIEWRPERMNVMLDLISRMGNARHKNLTRLLGFCYNKRMAYLLCDYLPNGNLAERIRTKRDWATKYKIILAIARGLCFLHHDCDPAIPHGDLKANNIVFDENMEPHLTEFGVKFLIQLNNGPSVARVGNEAGEIERAIKAELHRDIYNFGEVILEILTNGKLSNAATSLQNTSKEVLLREILDENDVAPSISVREEIKLVLEVASLCTRARPSDRPSMEEALKLASGLKKQG
ncbi:leucine-rich repeat receptor-like protein kinase TDR [Lycium ferocissimum]|uniref:leucine-rich repeat receptor-like protein kinase TDR n=1 Tax=Lycium ferocissimum TaxID=112874 RepID=UPI0028159EA7|nr:leucine-rich repeat receptor-like protein kinase TDR [Lycium ferocissimum]